MQYGPTQENVNLMIEKAKTKADCICRFRGVAYRIRDHRVTHYACNGRVLERCGWFDVEIGRYDDRGFNSDIKAAAALKGLK